jgi:hypothetical protein
LFYEGRRVFALQETGPSPLLQIASQGVYARSHSKSLLVIPYNVEATEGTPVWANFLQPPANFCAFIFYSNNQSRFVRTNVGMGLIINLARDKRFGLFGRGQ